MKTTWLTRLTFDSSHEDESCSKYVHGHQFLVEAESQRDDIEQNLKTIIEELHLRQLGRMLNGGSQTVDGLAAWFMERLLVVDPTVENVRVGFLDHEAKVVRERR
jgi:6-pyruvoyl-tetrahydropterin synthase